MRIAPLMIALLASIGQSPVWPADSYGAEIQRWRKKYDRDLLAPDGPFSLVARLTPKPGVSSIGRDGSNDLIVPIETAPARIGKIEWREGPSAALRLEPGVGAAVGGKAVGEVQISEPVTVTIGEIQL